MINPKISIIVPVYNAESFLHMCVDSIINQTFKELEIILINDGSRDNSGMICDEYEKKHSNVVVIHKKNGGNNSARKAGLAIARGKYVGFVDSDDWIVKDMYEYMYNKIVHYQCNLVTTGFIINTDKNKELLRDNVQFGFHDIKSLQEIVFPNLICYNKQFSHFGIGPSMGNKLFETDLVKTIICGVDDKITMGEDAALVFSYIFKSTAIFCSERCFYNYRVNMNSVTHTLDPNLWIIQDSMIKVLRENGEKTKYDFSDQIDSFYANMTLNAFIKVLLFNQSSLIIRIKTIRKTVKENISFDRIQAINKTLLYNNVPKKKFILLFCLKYRITLPIVVYYRIMRYGIKIPPKHS